MKKLLSMLLLLAVLAVGTTAALAASYVAFSGDANVRTGPGLGYASLGSVNAGSTLPYAGSTQYDSRGIAWYSVSFSGKTGWVSSVYGSITSSGGTATYGGGANGSSGSGSYYGGSTATGSIVSFSGDANVRTGPGLGYASIGVVYSGSTLPYTGSTSYDNRGVAWYSVSYNGSNGWVSSVYGTVTGGYSTYSGGYSSGYTSYSYITFSGDTNVRTGPGTSYASLGSVNKGSTLPAAGGTSYDSRGVLWYSVSFSGKTGWVSSTYGSPTSSAGTATYGGGGTGGSGTAGGSYYTSGSTVRATGSANVRSGPSLDYSVLTTMHEGDTASYLGSSSTDSRGVTWYKISFNGKTGWISSTYSYLY
ncbi:MAG: SH3 domain-containing protein [Clostridia bacterium]|nr:SH3 domain-containing protein [Clostridia bacterium]